MWALLPEGVIQLGAAPRAAGAGQTPRDCGTVAFRLQMSSPAISALLFYEKGKNKPQPTLRAQCSSSTHSGDARNVLNNRQL